jgi:hypothetical protein
MVERLPGKYGGCARCPENSAIAIIATPRSAARTLATLQRKVKARLGVEKSAIISCKRQAANDLWQPTERGMTDVADAYSMPASLEPKLAFICDYWRALRRGGNDIPFWDDVKFSALGSSAEDALLVDVFESPLRFRLGLAGRSMTARLGPELGGKFLDKFEPEGPFDHLETQCATTVRLRAPTFFRHRSPPGYARIALPLWGNGRIQMLLVAAVAESGD